MLNEREISLIIDGLIRLMKSLKVSEPDTYDECELLLAKLWQMRRDAHLASVK